MCHCISLINYIYFSKYCASPDGDVLEDFILELGKEENDDLINSMNCSKCTVLLILTYFVANCVFLLRMCKIP